MPKFIFISLLLISNIKSFGQKLFLNGTTANSMITTKVMELGKEKTELTDVLGYNFLLNDTLSEILAIKPSDLLDEDMLKKLKAKV